MKDTVSDRKNGFIEGVARSLSQSIVFCLDTQKTLVQVYGHGNAPKMNWGNIITSGMPTSMITSGIVFGSYYSIYNGIGSANWFAGPVAAITTSMMKVPISNTMRVMQSGLAKNPFDACRKIIKTQKVRGLYTGYGLSLLEDIVEFDTRNRMYEGMRGHFEIDDKKSKCKIRSTISGATLGSISGVATAYLTNPFDCIKSNMAISTVNGKKTAFEVAKHILRQDGIGGFYRGASLRATTSALKSALFFMFVEALHI